MAYDGVEMDVKWLMEVNLRGSTNYALRRACLDNALLTRIFHRTFDLSRASDLSSQHLQARSRWIEG